MQQAYLQIIESCERAISDLPKTQELLEYPEVQADKAYYLSLLNKFNDMQRLNAKLTQLKNSLAEQDKLLKAMTDLSEEEKTLAVEEIAALRQDALTLAEDISEALGCPNGTDEVFCRLLCSSGATEQLEKLFELVKQDLDRHGITVKGFKYDSKKDGRADISFTATGRNALARLKVLAGVHKVQNTSYEVALAVTPAESVVTVDEKDVKIDLFHSSGAGGQNINKVETAVRVTHVPTGTVVVCQDERSQLKNKRRALENLAERLTRQNAVLEKARMDADVKTQFKRVSTLSFTANGELTDKTYGAAISTQEQFSTYINSILAKGN